MSLTQYYTATSLDGFIADERHSLDWLFTRGQDRGQKLAPVATVQLVRVRPAGQAADAVHDGDAAIAHGD